jgi:hypothetical protein
VEDQDRMPEEEDVEGHLAKEEPMDEVWAKRDDDDDVEAHALREEPMEEPMDEPL